MKMVPNRNQQLLLKYKSSYKLRLTGNSWLSFRKSYILTFEQIYNIIFIRPSGNPQKHGGKSTK
ncbi:hypothetical protein BWD13_00920 [Leptospira santarosai serovar Grippotyphosa]|nr:hypothetical protein BWD13_00920 [Leptospira santarosai serovar Grippotyphosa]